MSRTFRSLNKTARFVVTALCFAAGLSTYGAMAMPPVLAVATTTASVGPVAAGSVVVPTGALFPAVNSTTVTDYKAACLGSGTGSEHVPVCQQPLTVQPSVPPNITLMLDDSGSMSWNFMPDWTYLNNYSNNDAVIDASNNGVYYDPTVTYTPPPQVTGTLYPSYTNMTSVSYNGFDATAAKVNLLAYAGSYDFNQSTFNNGVGSVINYNTDVDKFTYTYNYQDPKTGYYLPSWPGKNYDFSTKTGCDNWFADFNANRAYHPWFAAGETYDPGDSRNYPSCTIYYFTKPGPHYFMYSTGPAAGPYVVHYVASTTAECASSPDPTNCVAMGDTSGTAAPKKDAAGNTLSAGENIANWFAYYHTRILMAKTGLMTAFLNLNSNYRFGFASINANNVGDIPLPQFTFNDYTSGGGSSTNKLAEVQPFGDGSSSSQKYKFWKWIAAESASGNTPLRRALQGAGDYYETQSQPWSMMSTDPGYVSGGTNDTVIACRQAYTILTTDGFWNGQSPTVGDVDDKAGSPISGPGQKDYTYQPVLPFSDAAITTTSTPYSASCTQNPGDQGPDSTGTCTWTTYKCKKGKKTGHYYGGCPSGYTNEGVYHTGTYPVCNTGDTWDSSLNGGECVHTVTTSSGTKVSDTLADVAMHYWNRDLQTSISNEVPTNNEDPAFWQHMVTFTMGLGFKPVGISPAGTTSDQIFKWSSSCGSDPTCGGSGNPNAIANFSWPTPSSNSDKNIADLMHAGVNGHGGFFSATDPKTFISGLETALNRAEERTGSGASLAANSTQLQTGTVAYQATYHTVTWIGDLSSYPINQSDGTFGTLGWSASARLLNSATKNATTGVLSYPNRLVMTYNPAGSSGSKFVAFKNASASAPPSLSPAELAALGTSAATQANMVNYLRGDATYEGGTTGKPYRSRSTPLGDIVDSQPVYSGAPDPNAFVGQSFTGTSTYSAFATAQASRTGVVWVASNDGMLHGINASTGDEMFAYLPGAVITAGIANIANPTYGTDSNPHRDFNDGQLTIADAYFKASSGPASWHTVLVGTTGRGSAKAVYALDITDPSDVKFLWERSAGDGLSGSNYIGQMVGKPVIAFTSTDATKGPTWSVLIGNGYNSASDKAALLQFDLATGALYVHQTDSSTSNGLAAAVTWIGTPGNGLSTDAYAGDVLGRVWDFQLNATTCTTSASPVCTTSATPTSTGTKLFTAQDSSGTAQPITAGLLAGQDPNTSYTWVFFGTGKYLDYNDVKSASPQTQSWYGVIVQQGGVTTVGLPITTSSTKMVQRYITSQTAASSVTNADGTVTTTLAGRTVTPTPSPSDMSGKLGWYLDLQTPTGSGGSATYTSQGEMMVDPNQFEANLLLGTTRIPVVSDVCNPSGTGWIMALNPFTGTAPDNDFFDLNGDGKVNGGDEIGGKAAAGVGFGSMPNAPIFVGGYMLTSFQNASKSSMATAGGTGSFKRVSWREIVNE